MQQDRGKYWLGKLAKYKTENWSQRPSIFAQEAIKYFPKNGKLLELGAGLGQDGRFFAQNNFKVTSTDLTTQIASLPGIETQVVDMSKQLPFQKSSFDVVYAHLSLHYFDQKRTQQLFREIYNILRPGGVLAFLVNSIHDPEAVEGKEIEKDYRLINGIQKRFFTLILAQELTGEFTEVMLDENGTSYKDKKAGLTNLIRYVGKKIE
jgi:SAM-dependent methyltransferase